mmetsp:Transcript_9315/g.12677  ORF Transcript_9315/g.12677 Transcript_9315/m.12677 type:complete len:154 (-) Transcript_9315:193-654(-)|eukprot:CAMPEP_0185591346 /NCGR_PEP_ID=MMETSP0434-20130131/64151_1 /TAXON_ID=626734 ORGANISM="Favella taraikaensis, Strain Fe Narragansett Bay" /NCGR_SAMPLE_ID=MMETSP0434 /ASSEMBLY_ACC=CAM_ASM_000379 /LENGTH=153 /DNA_ID=CAMNT_0028216253 /DNA_START=193 /DNA_END=654 /DNA_ORIENTATION=+
MHECLNHDFKYWKVKRFVPDYATYANVCDIIKENIGQLKELFIVAAVESGSPPDIRRIPFFKFCERTKLLDKKMTASIIDTYFKATNFEVVDMDQNDDQALCRFEFFEIMVRIARGKYVETGEDKNLANAFSVLLQRHILPAHSELMPWQQWR